MTINNHRLLNRTSQSFGECRGVTTVVYEDNKLITAKTGESICAPHHFSKALSCCAEQFVANPVSEAVVDRLEVVEVNEQH